MKKTSDFEQKFFLFFLTKLRGWGPRHILELWDKYQSMDQLLKAVENPADNAQLSYLASQWHDQELKNKIHQEYLSLDQNNFCYFDDLYPPLLQKIYDPPFFIFYRGNTDLCQSRYLLTIIGSRRYTSYHQKMIREIMAGLAGSPIVIVSGLAYGCDGLAHQYALENNLATIAVLGTGLAKNDIYPAEHYQLSEKILAQGGLLLSEQNEHSEVWGHNFARRNRILAGLSTATLVISGAQKSGTMITARCALSENRDIMAMPGLANDPLSWTPHHLIKNGAMLIENAQDILDYFKLRTHSNAKQELILESERQQSIYRLLKNGPLNIETIAEKLALPLPILQSEIAALELNNIIIINNFNQVELN